MTQKQSSIPYRNLGKKLKALRNQSNETLAEASGAVEIDVRELAGFELGQSRPSEEILLLLISHFGAKDDEAIQLWELAGYGAGQLPAVRIINELSTSDVSPLTQPSSDEKIMFTDTVDVVVNNYGVVMNFMQGGGSPTGPKSVAKVGMSREHAKSVLQILKLTLAQTEAASRLPREEPKTD